MSLSKVFDYENSKVQTIVDEQSNIWFRGFTIASILGYEKPRNAIQRHVESDDKCIRECFKINRPETGRL